MPKGQLITYTGQYCQGIRQSSARLECPPAALSRQKISHLYSTYTHIFSWSTEREAVFTKSWTQHQCQRSGPRPVGYVHLAVLPGHQAELSQAGTPPRSRKQTKKYHISSLYTHTFSIRPQRGQSRLGLQKVDPSTDAKDLAPCQLDMYTWQFCQCLWQSLFKLERPPRIVSKYRSNTFSHTLVERFLGWFQRDGSAGWV